MNRRRTTFDPAPVTTEDPRLSILRQYPPRPMLVPEWYATERPPVEAPSISIVTPSYGQRDFLADTMDSVLGQEYPALEYVVQDGASEDGSRELLIEYDAQLTAWISEPDRGQADAINRGFARTTGEIMAWLNSDDLLLPGSLAAVSRYFAKHPEVDAVYGHRVVIDEHGLEVGRWVLPPHEDKVLRWADYVPQETLFWRRSLWERAGGRIDDSLRFAIDWDLLLRFLDAGARLVRLPRFLGAFRVHGSSKTIAGLHDQGEREMARLRKRVHGRDVDHEEIWSNICAYVHRADALQQFYEANPQLF